MAGETTPEESLEAFSLFWPAYFADPAALRPMPHVVFSKPANLGLWTDLAARLPELEASLRIASRSRCGVLVGELQPDAAERGHRQRRAHPRRLVPLEPGAGHFVWHERPDASWPRWTDLRGRADRLTPASARRTTGRSARAGPGRTATRRWSSCRSSARSASIRPNVGANLKPWAAPRPTTTDSWPGTGRQHEVAVGGQGVLAAHRAHRLSRPRAAATP